MTQHFQIKHQLTGAVLFEGRFVSMRLCVEAAVNGLANLSGANLSGANLSRADLSGANLSGANLSGVDLSGADLSGANLSGANLSGVDLSGANLSWADLSGADLSGANLWGANLSGADLSGACLSGANLSGANLLRAHLSGAIWCEGFTLNRAPVRTAQRRDGYAFYLLDTSQGWRISAGCRFFTYEEAWGHWCGPSAARRGRPLGDETQDILVMFSLALDREEKA